MGRRAVFLVAGVVVAALGVLVAINLFDEELTPEARALFEQPPHPFQRESGWALLMGFDAPPGEDPRAHAEQLWLAATRASAAGIAAPRRPQGLSIRAAEELQCTPEQEDCIPKFRARPESVAEVAADNRELLRRYESLMGAPLLGDATFGSVFDLPLVAGGSVMGTQRLRLSQAATLAGRGEVGAALALLEADNAFHRRLLAEGRSVISKMLPLRAHARGVLLAGHIARHAPMLSAPQQAALGRIVAPLSREERAMRPGILAEATFARDFLDRLVAAPRKTGEAMGATPFLPDIAGRTLCRNATLNFMEPGYAPWIALDALESAQLPAAIEAIRKANAERARKDWRWAYNFTGRSLAADGMYDFASYVYRVRDGDALAALVRCVVALRVARVPAESAGAFAASDPGCRDPYTGSGFSWEAQARTRAFKPAEPGSVARLGGSAGLVRFAPYVP